MASVQTGQADRLIALLDEAVGIDCVNQRCCRVKDVLEETFRSGEDWLPEAYLAPAGDKYARRLLHRDPAGRYSVVAMVWGVGQGTPLHDHAGEWCVECVYRGRIEVTSYDLESERGERFKFRKEKTIYAGVGEAGALIPPFEYHTIANAQQTPSVTIHVYGHELTWCHVFVPADGAWVRQRRELCYTS